MDWPGRYSVIDALHGLICLLLWWQRKEWGGMARPRSHMTPAQKAWATAHNTNEHYQHPQAMTERQRTARLVTCRLAEIIRILDDPHGNYDRLGLADMHTDIVQRLETMRAAVEAAGEEGE